MQELNSILTLLDQAVSSLKARGRMSAQADHDYRVALAKKLAELRAEGNPVTHLLDIARGEKEVARLRMERDIAETMYDSCREAINAYKLKARLIEAQIDREWGRREVV